MRYAILADIHSNLEAFTAILEDIKKRNGGVDEIWCLGDVVGYGPDPRACLDLLWQHKHICIAGNHDWAAVGKVELSHFNPDAAAACLWTMEQLRPEDIDYLKNLPLTMQRGDFTLVHGSPREPIWEYLVSADIAKANFPHLKTLFCLVGHSHLPLIFEFTDSLGNTSRGELPGQVPLRKKNRCAINPGGVGQPRDRDPRTSYAIYDGKKGILYHYRIPYEISVTQGKMRERGLPPRLAQRLSYGW